MKLQIKLLTFIMTFLLLLGSSGCIKRTASDCPDLTYMPREISRPKIEEIKKDAHIGSVAKAKELAKDTLEVIKWALDLETAVVGYENQVKAINEKRNEQNSRKN